MCGGGLFLEGLCPCCRIHRGDYVQVVKKYQVGGGGGLSILQKHGGLCPPIQK